MLPAVLLLASLVQHPDTLRLPDLVTTATRLPGHRGVVTSAHTVLDGADLRRRGVVFLLDALREVPGLVTVQAGSRGAATSVFLRGGESDYVKVLIDGVPMNAPGGAFNFANLTTDNVGRVEVIRGPASVLYGADAMTGVIQIFTREGRGSLVPEVALEAGTQGGRRISGGLVGVERGVAVTIQAATTVSDGHYAFNSGHRNTGWSARIASASSGATRAQATVRSGDVRTEFPTNSSGALVDSNQYLTERQLALGAEVTRRVSRFATLHLSAALSRTADGFLDRADHPGDTSGFAFLSRRGGRVRRSEAELRVALGGVRGPAGTIGLHYADERQRQAGTTTSNFGGGPFTEDDGFAAARSTRASFVEARFPIRDRLTLTGGARLDHNSAFGTSTSWRLGATARPGAGLTLRAQAGQAFKAPTFPELFADTPFEVGDPLLQPERATSWEVGAEQRVLDGRLLLSAAWFQQHFRDLIQYAAAAPGEPTYGNIAAATSRGLELTAGLIVSRRLELTGQASLGSTRVTDAGGGESPAWRLGKSLLRRPRLTASMASTWRVTGTASVHLVVHHLGARDDVDFREFPSVRVPLPARTIADLAVDLRLDRQAPGLAVTARLENMLGESWNQVVGFPGSGRAFTVGLRVAR